MASLFLAIFSVGVAVGSIAINRLLQGHVSAKYAPASVLMMGAFVWFFDYVSGGWRILGDLAMIAITGGMFVVPLYAFLTTTVAKSETARTVAANNIVNSGAMVLAALILFGLVHVGVSIADTLLMVAIASLGSAWLAWQLHLACD